MSSARDVGLTRKQRRESGLTRKQRREQARVERKAREAAARARAARRKRLRFLSGALGTALVIAAVLLSSQGGSKSWKPEQVPPVKTAPLASLGKLSPAGNQGELGPERIPIPLAPSLADTSNMASGQTVDGMECLGGEQLLFHIHAHLTMFVNSLPRQIPYGIGITEPKVRQTGVGAFVGGGTCFYWLHTHAADGIVHIEAPVKRTFTLGNFFDIWGQPLSGTQVGPAKGRVTAFYNGRVFLGDPRYIPLTNHAQIQLDVGQPLVAPVSLTSFGGLP